MKQSKLALAVLATFLTIFILTTLLTMIPSVQNMMSSMQIISRDPQDYANHIGYLLTGHFLQSVFFVAIYYQFKHNVSTLKSGALIGSQVGAFLAFTNVALYSMLKIELLALVAWSISDLINFTVAGVLVAFILKSKEKSAQK